MKRLNKLILCGMVLFVAGGPPASGNDSAASTALGGIQLRREPRVAMLKEKLTISTEKVTVEYEFRNESDQDITTEVAFPVPPYGMTSSAAGIRTFDDFKVWVQGVQLKYQVAVRGKVQSKDYTEMLKKYAVDIASLGHLNESGEEPFSADFRKLSKPAQEALTKAGLFDPDDHLPDWTVEKTYHWRQTFPAHKILHVRHEYEPGVGFRLVEGKFLDRAVRKKEVDAIKRLHQDDYRGLRILSSDLDSVCIVPKLEPALIAAADKDGYVRMMWVDYILTTANSWKTPINDFELVFIKAKGQNASLCWNGPIERIDENRMRAKVKNFIPKTELRIAYFY